MAGMGLTGKNCLSERASLPDTLTFFFSTFEPGAYFIWAAWLYSRDLVCKLYSVRTYLQLPGIPSQQK